MKLKYYLRGVGIGIVVTTLLFMILLFVQKEEAPQEEKGQNTESKTVASLEKDAQKATEDEKSGDKTDSEEMQPDQTEDAKKQPDQKETEQPDVNRPEEMEPETENASEAQPDAEEASESKTKEKVRFEIKGGEYSDTISRKLAEQGLIDSAEKFNRFLVEKDYDNLILPGIYDIPKDATYEEIAALLVTKVE